MKLKRKRAVKARQACSEATITLFKSSLHVDVTSCVSARPDCRQIVCLDAQSYVKFWYAIAYSSLVFD